MERETRENAYEGRRKKTTNEFSPISQVEFTLGVKGQINKTRIVPKKKTTTTSANTTKECIAFHFV